MKEYWKKMGELMKTRRYTDLLSANYEVAINFLPVRTLRRLIRHSCLAREIPDAERKTQEKRMHKNTFSEHFSDHSSIGGDSKRKLADGDTKYFSSALSPAIPKIWIREGKRKWMSPGCGSMLREERQ